MKCFQDTHNQWITSVHVTGATNSCNNIFCKTNIRKINTVFLVASAVGLLHGAIALIRKSAFMHKKCTQIDFQQQILVDCLILLSTMPLWKMTKTKAVPDD